MLKLQRGRARAGAEISKLKMSQARTDQLLQRGRARAGAEILTLRISHAGPMTCFNGAAPARARKFGCCLTTPIESIALQRGRARAGAEMNMSYELSARLVMLQRGRARAGAEIKSSNKAWGKRRDASTGPRPRGRGNL